MSSENNTKKYAELTEQVAQSTGGFGGEDENNGIVSEEERPWEDEIEDALKAKGKMQNIETTVELKGDFLVFTWDKDRLTLIRHVDDFSVGEKKGTFHYTVLEKDWERYSWFRDVFGEKPVGLRAIKEVQGKKVERIIYPN